MTERTATPHPAPRRAISIRATILSIAAVAFGFILFTGLAIALRVVPSAAAIAARGASARDDYTARTVLAARLDSSISDGWRLLRLARAARIAPESIAVRRVRVEGIMRGAGEIAPFRPQNDDASRQFATNLEYADAAASNVAAALLGALGALETGEIANAELLMSRADSLDAPLTERLNQVTQLALADLAAAEKNLEADARFASGLLMVWLLVFFITSPLLWRLVQRRLMQPLASFNTALNRVERGDLDVEIPVEYEDELGRLGTHFNRTTQVLRTQRAEGERMAAQAALEASEARYRTAFEEAAIGLAEIALDGTLLRINRTMGNIFGTDPDAIVGRRFLDYAHPDDAAVIAERWPIIVGGEAPVTRVERRFIRADGTVAIAHVTASLLRHSDGSPRHVLVVLNDATEQRRLERELMQATKMEAMGQLAGGVAHDFNNLLAGIIGYAELIENDSNIATVRDDAASIRRAALKGADLARSLLTLARRNTHREEPFALEGVLQETADLVRRTFDRRVNVELVIEDAPTIRGDRSLIANALLNLAVNARDAMPEGGDLRIAARVGYPDADFRVRHELPLEVPIATVDVVDTGTGMSPEVLSRVFEPFFTTKAVDKGTGLGLAMAYGTAKDHSGAITIQSAVGMGTTVTLHLPCSYEAQDILAEAPAPVRARKPSRILVVDDEPLIRSVATRLLQRIGYEVESVEDGIVALERLDSDDHGIDLVIIDGNMPRLNGIETARRIHARHPELPMIFATGHFDPDGDEELSDLGFRGRIEKPYSFETLASVVARYIEPVAKAV